MLNRDEPSGGIISSDKEEIRLFIFKRINELLDSDYIDHFELNIDRTFIGDSSDWRNSVGSTLNISLKKINQQGIKDV